MHAVAALRASSTTCSSAGAERRAAEPYDAVLRWCRRDRLGDVQGISLRGSEVMKLSRKGGA